MNLNFLSQLQRRAFTRVDIASLVFFRVSFGLLMAWHASWYLFNDRIARYWLEPRFLFKYPGFSWVQPWPGHWLYVHWVVLVVLGLLIAAGFCYRISALLFCLGYTYTFLLDEALWVNHRYLICLLSFICIFLPAHRAFSIDAWLRPGLRSQTAPAWILWILRTQMGVVYFYAGVAKLMPDWLHGEPMRVWLARSTGFPVIGRFFRDEWCIYGLSYAGFLFDLLVVPALLWRRTRPFAFCCAVAFHVMNSQLFRITVFPWLAIATTTIFLDPDWPRRLLAWFGKKTAAIKPAAATEPRSSLGQRLMLTFVVLYIAIQILVPLRPFFYHGGIEWWEHEHRYTWRMLLTSKWVHSYFYVTDPNSGESYQVTPDDYLAYWASDRMGWRPDMLVQYAHYLASVMPRSGYQPLRVEARVQVALNGREPRLFINQNVDLAAEERPLGRPTWLLEVHEPLPDHPREKPLENPFEAGVDDLE